MAASRTGPHLVFLPRPIGGPHFFLWGHDRDLPGARPIRRLIASGQRSTADALARFGPEYTARLERGRSYARQGRVHDLGVTNGVVTASVTGSRPKP